LIEYFQRIHYTAPWFASSSYVHICIQHQWLLSKILVWDTHTEK